MSELPLSIERGARNPGTDTGGAMSDDQYVELGGRRGASAISDDW